MQLGKYNFKKGDNVVPYLEAAGYNSAQWQRPMELLPERFDSKNPLSLTPDGKKRHPYSFIPFHGGARACFGRTLADANLRMLITYMTQKFDFEFEDARYQTDVPIAQMDQSHKASVWLRVTPRQK